MSLSSTPPMTIIDAILQLDALDPNSEEFRRILLLVLSPEFLESVSQLQTVEAQGVIDVIDRALDSCTTRLNLSRKCLRILRKICGKTGLLPSSHMLSEGLQKVHVEPVAFGGFADIWLGKYWDLQTAIKALRIYLAGDSTEVMKKFCKEVIIWRRLSHPHVVPFLGVSDSLFQSRLCMISEWMAGGNVTDYVKSHPEANRPELLKGVAKGLQYLHDSGVVHGDLKGPNILVDNLGRARLADFGLACILCDPNTVNPPTTKSGSAGSTRWMAPELFDPEIAGLDSSRPSKASDIYAFGMVVYEVFKGNVPFVHLRDPAVISHVLRGSKLDRPANTLDLGLSDGIWKIVQTCWQSIPDKRPEISDVLKLWDNSPAMVASDIDILDSFMEKNLEVGLIVSTVAPSVTGRKPTVPPPAQRSSLVPLTLESKRGLIKTQLTPMTPSTKRSSAQKLRVRGPSLAPRWAVTPRVLLVEDDAVSRILSSKFLQILGCTTDVAVDGYDAVDKMSLGKYDLALMDVVIPKLDGLSATSAIRQFDHMTPIILMTSTLTPSVIMNASGSNDILRKPFTKESLLGILEKYLAHLRATQPVTKVPWSISIPPLPDNAFEPTRLVQAQAEANESVLQDTPGGSASWGKTNPLSGTGLTDEQYTAILLNTLSGRCMEVAGLCPGAPSGSLKRSLEDEQDQGSSGKRGRVEIEVAE